MDLMGISMVVKHMLKLGVDTREKTYKELVLMVHGTNAIDMMEGFCTVYRFG